MTTDRDFDRIAKAWLADGPDELSVRVLDAVVDDIHVTRQRRAWRVPWRSPTMTSPARVATAAVIGAIVVGAAFLILRPGQPAVGAPTASPSPSAVVSDPPPSTAPASLATSTGTVTFTSPLNGFSVAIPGGWTTKPATAVWAPGRLANWGDPALDDLHGSSVRFVGTSQPIAPATSEEAWIQAYRKLVKPCQGDGTTPARMLVGDLYLGAVIQGGCQVNSGNGSISATGHLYDLVVVAGGRGYDFTMDGDVDRALFASMLSSVKLDPVAAFAEAPLPLTTTFQSPTYGYSIGHADGWKVTPATDRWADLDTAAPFVDELDPTGTDTFIQIASQPLKAGTTFERWLADYRTRVVTNLAEGGLGGQCDPGDPSSWPTVPIGSETGRFYDLCNYAGAVAQAGGRVYLFTWENATHTASSHFGEEAFKSMLKTVTFDPGAAKD